MFCWVEGGVDTRGLASHYPAFGTCGSGCAKTNITDLLDKAISSPIVKHVLLFSFSPSHNSFLQTLHLGCVACEVFLSEHPHRLRHLERLEGEGDVRCMKEVDERVGLRCLYLEAKPISVSFREDGVLSHPHLCGLRRSVADLPHVMMTQ